FVSDESFVNPAYSDELKRRREEEEKRRRSEQAAGGFYHGVAHPEEMPEEGWFTSEAKFDIAILKKEYRILVKKYHPDVSQDARTARILQSIMNERADILESMKG
ncbi:MAG: hypothetical protein J6N76_09980, partial [Lachnospiraceae bacterium]|nr:hypothetical protein [Lachnospiraceae bacterium]